jgi:methyl-accepting chemotaxis protein
MSIGVKNVQTGNAVESIMSVATDWNEICKELCAQLGEIGQALDSICQETDPLFIQTGRDLQAVARESRTLTKAIRQTAGLIGGDEGQRGPLERTEQLIRDVQERLTYDRREIEQDLSHIRDLMLHIVDSRHINDVIDRISVSFRAVRINIRIQCSVLLGNDDMFRDVIEDIDTLSKSLTRIAKQVKVDLSISEKNLFCLERTVYANLLESERVAASAKDVVTRAYEDIRQLLLSTRNMMWEASRRADVITGMVDSIVVGIQFHDSLNQRTSHILQAFTDVTNLCARSAQDFDPEALCTAFQILDLQHRQLEHITDEVSAIHLRIKQSFSSIGAEVKDLTSIIVNSQHRADDSELLLGGLYTSLQKGLLQLCELVAEGEGMIDRFKNAAADTRTVAGRLVEIMHDVRAMRESTHLQAINTIIMASNLGEQGRTIQVLAKEISTLSEQTSELVPEVEGLQHTVHRKVENLCENWEKGRKGVSRSELEGEVSGIDGFYREVKNGCSLLTAQIESSCRHIEDVYGRLGFIQKLQEGLGAVAAQVERARDTLLPWRDQASSDSSEINQLIQRYTMEQERLIHMFDLVEAEQVQQNEGIIFF